MQLFGSGFMGESRAAFRFDEQRSKMKPRQKSLTFNPL